MLCKFHPKYKAIHAPRSTKNHPDGCITCWEIFNGCSSKTDETGYPRYRPNLIKRAKEFSNSELGKRIHESLELLKEIVK